MIKPFRPLALAAIIVTIGINASSHVREQAHSEIDTFAYASVQTRPGAVAGASDCSDPESPDNNSHLGAEPRDIVMLGLDPSIDPNPHPVRSLGHSFLRAATDARVKPEHDFDRAATGQNENHRSQDDTEQHRTGASPNVRQIVTGSGRISAPCATTRNQTPDRPAPALATRQDIARLSAMSDDCRLCDGTERIVAGPTDLGRLVAGRFAPTLLENRVAPPGVVDRWTIPRNAAATIRQGFDPPWNDKLSPDGLWRVNGPWTGTGGNVLDPSLARIASRSNSLADASLLLTVAANEKRGSEIQTLQGYGYGYYETRMQVTSEPGVVASFFWIEAPKYGPHEWDIEFLTNESWIGSANAGQVHLTLHPSNTNVTLPLPFNPSKAFHTYGFLWTVGRIVFTVDGKAVHTFTATDLSTTAAGFIMMNTWTGNPNWGGGPPGRPATTAYNWAQFTAGATDIPAQ